MAITTPYKSNTVSSVSGTTFNSNGTPFAVGDVGRLIILEDGDGRLQARKIVSYTDTNTVEVDHAWDTNPFLNSVDDVAPASLDNWAMSYLQTDSTFTSEAGVTVSGEQITITALILDSGAYVHITNAQVDVLSAGIECRQDAGMIFGWYEYIAGEDAQVKDSCCIVDGTTGTGGGQWAGASSDFGMLDIYGGLISIDHGSTGNFWRCYNDDANKDLCQCRWINVQCHGNPGLGGRVDGNRSIIIMEYVGADNGTGLVNPRGAVSRVEITAVDCKQAVYVWLSPTDGGPEGRITFNRLFNINDKIVRCASSDHPSGDHVMEILGKKSEIDAASVFIEYSHALTGGSHYFRYGNLILPNFVDTDVTAITENIYTDLIDSDTTPTSVDTNTITDGQYPELFARHTDIEATTATNKNLSDGTQYAPYTLLVGSYNYNLVVQVIDLEDTFDAAITLIDDTNIVQTTEATVAAYTWTSYGANGFDVAMYEYAKYEKVLNHLTHPSNGELLLTNSNGKLDAGAQDLVFSLGSGADDIVDITTTGDGTLNINHPATFTMPTFTGLITTGDVTFNGHVPDDITITAANVYITSDQDLTNVTITGNLHINVASNLTVDYSNVTVTGSVFNDAASNTLTINASNGSSMTAGDPGTGNGQTNIVNAVTVSVHVIDADDGSDIQNARVYMIANETVGTITTGDVILNGLTNASGIVEDTAFNYEGAFDPSGLDCLVTIRKGSASPYYKPIESTAVTITSSGYSNNAPLVSDE